MSWLRSTSLWRGRTRRRVRNTSYATHPLSLLEHRTALTARSILGVGIAIACLTTPTLATQLMVTGPASVIDGDTVVVAGTTVRLKGVDAAELGTALGENARRVMEAIVTGPLICRLTG